MVRGVHRMVLELAGHGSGQSRLTDLFRSRLVYQLFLKVHEAFIAKAVGGDDDLGQSWAPLKPATVAYRKTAARLLEQRGLRGKRVRGLLTPAQDAMWRVVFFKEIKRLMAQGFSEKAAKKRAAPVAWEVVKAMGAKTKIGTLANRPHKIMIETGRLEKSWRPGRLSRYSYVQRNEQEVRYSPGRIELASDVPYSDHQHRMRKIVPPGKLLGPWLAAAAQFAVDAVVRELDRQRL